MSNTISTNPLEDFSVYNNQVQEYIEPTKVTVTDVKGVEHEYLVQVKYNGKTGPHDLSVDGYDIMDIYCQPNSDETKLEYSPYDGVEGYGWYGSLKEAIEAALRVQSHSDTEEECYTCGGGGCIHCDPKSFI